jgi:ABC-2 type transport system ATP-binding protein
MSAPMSSPTGGPSLGGAGASLERSGASLERSGPSVDTIVVADKLSRWYGQVIALNAVSLTLARGVTGLLGPNGAGKTTFLRLLVGLIRPTAGAISVFGQTPFDAVQWRRRLGYCPEHDHFYEEMTGLAFVTLMTQFIGFTEPEARKKAATALERVRLGGDDAAKKPIGQYSKGMRQKVKIAQALAHEPELIVLDEPLTGADPLSRAHINDLIKDLGRSGHTVVVSSHVLHEVERVTQDFVLIDHGRLLAQGNVTQIRELIDHHPHRIEILCANARRLASALAALPVVIGLEIPNERTVVVQTPTPDACYDAIARLALEANAPVLRMSSPDNNLEAVFRFLTRG